MLMKAILHLSFQFNYPQVSIVKNLNLRDELMMKKVIQFLSLQLSYYKDSTKGNLIILAGL